MQLIWLSAFVAAPLLIGFLGSMATVSSVDTWYAGLIKPLLNPPSFVFGPVWTVLYVLMGIASYRIFQSREKDREQARASLIFYGMHLIVNLAWSFVFFGMQSPEGALWVIALLLVMIVVMMRMFRKLDHAASWLLLPYLVWVSFATYLNISVAYLN